MLTRTEQTGGHAASSSSLQARTLRMFTALYPVQHSFRRKFTLCLGNDEFAPAVALAVLGLGGTCLTLDSDGKRLQSAGRGGAVDFTVSSLSEALRILKNEVRKGTPVSVGLAEEPELSIKEMLYRGVQPDLICVNEAGAGLLEPFLKRGSLRVSLPPVLPLVAGDWHLRCNEAANMIERRHNDAKLLTCPEREEQEHDRLHRLWLKTAPRLFPKDRNRMYWSTT